MVEITNYPKNPNIHLGTEISEKIILKPSLFAEVNRELEKVVKDDKET